MQTACDSLTRFQGLRQWLAEETGGQGLDGQAQQIATLVGGASCSIMLVGSPVEGEPRMNIHAHSGPLPHAALQAAIRRGEGISGHVLASGMAILVADIDHSEFARLARRGDGFGNSLMCAPIRIGDNVAGVINTRNAAGMPPFDQTALCVLELAAWAIARSLQVQQLKHLLHSRFAQHALMHEAADALINLTELAYQNGEDMAKMLARSFFREMHRAGFRSGHVVAAASELIGELNREIHAASPGQ